MENRIIALVNIYFLLMTVLAPNFNYLKAEPNRANNFENCTRIYRSPGTNKIELIKYRINKENPSESEAIRVQDPMKIQAILEGAPIDSCMIIDGQQDLLEKLKTEYGLDPEQRKENLILRFSEEDKKDQGFLQVCKASTVAFYKDHKRICNLAIGAVVTLGSLYALVKISDNDGIMGTYSNFSECIGNSESVDMLLSALREIPIKEVSTLSDSVIKLWFPENKFALAIGSLVNGLSVLGGNYTDGINGLMKVLKIFGADQTSGKVAILNQLAPLLNMILYKNTDPMQVATTLSSLLLTMVQSQLVKNMDENTRKNLEKAIRLFNDGLTTDIQLTKLSENGLADLDSVFSLMTVAYKNSNLEQYLGSNFIDYLAILSSGLKIGKGAQHGLKVFHEKKELQAIVDEQERLRQERKIEKLKKVSIEKIRAEREEDLDNKEKAFNLSNNPMWLYLRKVHESKGTLVSADKIVKEYDKLVAKYESEFGHLPENKPKFNNKELGEWINKNSDIEKMADKLRSQTAEEKVSEIMARSQENMDLELAHNNKCLSNPFLCLKELDVEFMGLREYDVQNFDPDNLPPGTLIHQEGSKVFTIPATELLGTVGQTVKAVKVAAKATSVIAKGSKFKKMQELSKTSKLLEDKLDKADGKIDKAKKLAKVTDNIQFSVNEENDFAKEDFQAKKEALGILMFSIPTLKITGDSGLKLVWKDFATGVKLTSTGEKNTNTIDPSIIKGAENLNKQRDKIELKKGRLERIYSQNAKKVEKYETVSGQHELIDENLQKLEEEKEVLRSKELEITENQRMRIEEIDQYNNPVNLITNVIDFKKDLHREGLWDDKKKKDKKGKNDLSTYDDLD